MEYKTKLSDAECDLTKNDYEAASWRLNAHKHSKMTGEIK
jgi:hypothetical protein